MVSSAVSPPALSKRVMSLDAFRGFVMFSMLLHTFGLKELANYPVVGFIYNQLNHAPWRGFHFEDIILPWFLFAIGVAMAISDTKRQERGETYKVRITHAAKRAVTLFCLGFILSWIGNGKPYFGAGVLQILAICYLASFLFLGKSIRFQFGVFAALLFIYWFFVFIIPVPEAGRNSYELYKNLVYYLDNIIIGSATRWGYLYTLITSTAVVVYGNIIGKLLINRTSHKQFMKTLAILGVVGILSGIMLNPFIPIIKRMFTSSYTLFTCGLISLLFLVFYWLIDVRGCAKWSFPFIVFGMNSIFVYMVNMLFRTWLVETGGIFVGPLAVVIGVWVSPLKHFVRLLAEWFLCFWLYRRKIFIKI